MTNKQDREESSMHNHQDNETEKNSILDEQWQALTNDWQEQSYQKTDVSKLLQQTRRRTYSAKALLWLDIIATIGILIAFFYGLYEGTWDTATLIYLGFGGFGSVFYVYYEIKIRQKAWKLADQTPESAVENARDGCESSIQYIKLIKFSSWIMLIAGNWYVYERATQADKPVLVGMLIVSGVIAVMYGVTHWFHVKRKSELIQLNDMLGK